MSAAVSIESGILTPDIREALRALLSQNVAPYLEFSSTANAPGVCICTSYADFRRHVEAEYQAKLMSQPIVPANYRAGGGRRKLPEAPVRYLNAETQTEGPSEPTGRHTESASDNPSCRSSKSRKSPATRAIGLSSTDTDSGRPPRPALSQSLQSLP
jgi:hypothetical protein